MQVVVDGLLTSYEKSGSGKKTILMVHGWADQSSTFKKLSKYLEADYEMYSVDLPGFGKTEIAKKEYSLDDFANFLKNFCTKINLNPDIIIGHSNGGAIAITAVASGKLNPSFLILIASSGIRMKSLKKTGLKIVSKPAKLVLAFVPKNTGQKLKGRLYKSIGSDYMINESMKETFRKIVSTDITELARELVIPVCLIYGSQDTSTPPVFGHKFNQLINKSILHIIPGSSHYLHQEKPEEIAKIIERFTK